MIVALAWAARAEVVVEAPPVVGQETVISLTDTLGDADSGETVRVVHRPGLAGSREVAVGITDGRGRVRWTPGLAGVTRIRAGDETLDVRVEPDRPPPLTLTLLGLLGALGAAILLVVPWLRRR